MAKFYFKRIKMVFVTSGGNPVILPDAVTGMPTLFIPPAKSFRVENGYLETEDAEQIARIRKDPAFGTDEIRELSAEDERAMQIQSKYAQMAKTEIEKLKDTPK